MKMKNFVDSTSSPRRSKIRVSGFTFVELLVVITIIAVLTTAVTSAYSTVQKRTRDSRRKSDMTVMKGALEEYYTATGAYPVAGSCSLASTNLQGSWPSDPGTFTYTQTCVGTTPSSFCLCALLELTGTGNASNTTCSWGGAKSHYCVQNSQ